MGEITLSIQLSLAFLAHVFVRTISQDHSYSHSSQCLLVTYWKVISPEVIFLNFFHFVVTTWTSNSLWLSRYKAAKALVLPAFKHLLWILNHETCERARAWQLNGDVLGPSVLMKQPLWCWYVWNERGTTTDSWNPALCRATVRPLSQHESAGLRTVLATVSSCVCTPLTGKKKQLHLDYEWVPFRLHTFFVPFHLEMFT